MPGSRHTPKSLPMLPAPLLRWLGELGWDSRTAVRRDGCPVLVWLMGTTEACEDNPVADWVIAPLVSELIEWLPDPHACAPWGTTPLESAVHSARLTRILLDAGAEVAPANEGGNNVFLSALWAGTVDVVRMLMAAGADPHQPDSMLRAASGGKPEMVRFLLEQGVSPDQASSDGKASLLQINFRHCAATVEVLLDAGADVAARTHAGHSVLIEALSTGASLGLLERLLKAGAPVRQASPHGPSPLVTAAHCAPHAIPMLLDAGASCQEIDDTWDAPSALAKHMLEELAINEGEWPEEDSWSTSLALLKRLVLEGGSSVRLRQYLSDMSSKARVPGELLGSVDSWELANTLPSPVAAPRRRL